MSESKKEIKKGCIDFYYSMKIETKLNYEDLCKSISNKRNLILNNYYAQAKATFEEEIENIKSNLNLENLKVKNDCENKEKNECKIERELFSKSIKNIEVEFTDNGIKIYPILDLHEEVNALEEELADDYDTCLKIYGEIFVTNCKRFYLPPFKVQLINDEIVFIKAILYIFKNGMMILRISIPIENIDMAPLFDNNLEGYIKGIIDLFEIGYEFDIRKNGLENLKNAYFNFIKDSDEKIENIGFISATLKNVILADFEGIPDDIKNILPTLEEDLYRIIEAPIMKRHSNSFLGVAKEYLEKNSDTYDGVKYITSSMGKCVSIIDKTIVDYLNENGKIEDECLYRRIINSIRVNIEFSLIIILLKKTNSVYTFFQKEICTKSFDEIQKEYFLNNIFILELQQACFGSVREQLSFLEEKMIYFLDTKETQEKINSIDYIITADREKRNFNFQNFLSIGGVLLTIFLGLPAIFETLTILKKYLFFYIDIPIINIGNSSIIIWIILVICVLLKVLSNNTNNKN